MTAPAPRRPQGMPHLPQRAAGLAGVYALGALAGLAAWRGGVPLPWMLGPFFTFAALSAGGLRLPLLPMGRELAQVAIGLAIGLRFTPPVLAAMAGLVPEMVLATLYLVAVTMTSAFLFRRLAGVDPITAFFATAAGGMADMADVAARHGGAPGSVAVVHAMRVSVVVATAPFIVIGTMGRPAAAGFGPPGDLAGLPLLGLGLAAGALGAWALKRAPLPNRWLSGPILVGIALSLSGVTGIVVPGWLIVVAQVVLGVWLGCQFRRDMLTALPRVTISAAVIAVFLIGMAILGGLVMSATSGMPFATAFLALAPAAVAEMVLVAKVLQLDVETVAAFHVMRIVIISGTVLVVFRIYCRLGGVRIGS